MKSALLLATLLAGAGMTAHAAPSAAASVDREVEETRPLYMAASDCHAVGQQVASENGGQLARATPASQGGRLVCVIVVLVPGKDGERPRRMEVVVPQG